MMRSIERRAGLVRAGCAVAMSAGVLACASCNIVGPMGFLVGGEEKVSAAFALPAERSVVVFVDDRSSVLPSRAVRERIAATSELTLLEGGAAPKADIVSAEAIATILAGEKATRQSGIAEIGAAVGADVVVYATVDAFTLSPDGNQYAPTSTLRVKVVDVKTKARLWPESPQEWQVLNVQTPVKSDSVPTKQGERAQAEQELAARTGTQIGQLFIKHNRRESNPRIGS